MAAGSFFGWFERASQMCLATLLLLAVTPAISAAQSGSSTCRALEAQLSATASSRSPSSTQIKRYDDAIQRQQDQMARARAHSRQAGCGFAMTGKAIARCGELNATLARMEANLAQLQRKRASLGARKGNKRDRNSILAALQANDCRRSTSPAKARAATPAENQILPPDRQAAKLSGNHVRNLKGNFRTLCVRSCDGYYFPISWSVSQSAFARDAHACQAMCPNTQVELHYHRVAGEEPEDMVSATTGLAYRDSENAFLYRQTGAPKPEGCGCGPGAQEPAGFTTIGGDYASNQPGFDVRADHEALTATIPQPQKRPDPADDPETLATREGGLDADGIKELTTPPSSIAAKAGPRQIRRVGPAFFPDR